MPRSNREGSSVASPDGGLRVAVDVSCARPDPTGVGVYVRDLASHLIELQPERVALIGVRSSGPLEDSASRAAAWTAHPGGQHHRWLHTRALADARTTRATIAHYTNASAPLGPGVPFVLTVQDLSTVRYPRYHPPLRVATIPIVALSAHRARAVIVPSLATRDELVRLFRVPSRRILVVPHAAGTAASQAASAVDRLAAIRTRLGIGDDPYVLSIGTLEPRKNQVRLAEAFARLAGQRPDLHLVLVGETGWRGGEIVDRVRQNPVADRIHVAGYLPADDVTALMGGAAVVAYVSLYEGFGLPILEAMEHGIPVVTSRRSSMPEVAGDAAVLVDPFDVGAIETGLRTALADRDRLAIAGRRRAAERHWDDVAGETWEIYRWVAAARRAPRPAAARGSLPAADRAPVPSRAVSSARRRERPSPDARHAVPLVESDANRPPCPEPATTDRST
jgi:glycosyltransferase involved in cell wall biosynthesis